MKPIPPEKAYLWKSMLKDMLQYVESTEEIPHIVVLCDLIDDAGGDGSEQQAPSDYVNDR
jgi:hypothetical protein